MIRLAIAICAVVLGTSACGGDDSSGSSDRDGPEDITTLVVELQEAVAEHDDKAVCSLIDFDHANEAIQAVGPNGDQLSGCRIETHVKGGESIPEAEITDLHVSRSGDTGQVLLSNGTKLFLRRAGENADGKWLITGTGYRPSAVD